MVARHPAGGRRIRHVGLIVTLLIGLPVTVLLVWPQAFGAQQAPFVAQLIAFRAPLAIGLGVVAIVAAAVALLRRRWGVAAGVAIVLGVSGIANGAVLVDRGPDAALPAGELTVLVWNTQGGATPPEDVARLIAAADADIVSLPEMDEDAAAEVARLMAAEGHGMTPDTTYGETGDSWIPTSVLIADDLGEYRVDAAAGSTPGLPSAVWRPVDGSGPTIVTAHPIPPLPGTMADWKAGLRWIAEQCDTSDVIVAGDLNATVDHMSGLGAGGESLIGHCQDAALQANAGAVGTWPATVPTWIASPIDHILVGSGWIARGVQVITSYEEGSDHRPIVAVLDAR